MIINRNKRALERMNKLKGHMTYICLLRSSFVGYIVTLHFITGVC